LRQLNRFLVTIVGVAPPNFHGSMPGVAFDGWVPMALGGELNRDGRNSGAIARLKSGVSVAQVSMRVSVAQMWWP
jgi:hypothetical protein